MKPWLTVRIWRRLPTNEFFGMGAGAGRSAEDTRLLHDLDIGTIGRALGWAHGLGLLLLGLPVAAWLTVHMWRKLPAN